MQTDAKPNLNIPAETSQAAHRIYSAQQIYLRIGDQLESILGGIDLALLNPFSSLNSDTTFRLGLTNAFQYAESLPDPLAAEATLKRLDWKYALCLPIQHPGISKHSLCIFRQGLYSSFQSQQEFGKLLSKLSEIGLFTQSKNITLDPSGTIFFLCRFNRLYGLHQAMKAVLSFLISSAPDWVAGHISPFWYERYRTGQPFHLFYASLENMHEEAIRLGKDIQYLLETVRGENMPLLADSAEIQMIARLLKDEFYVEEDQLHWQEPVCATCSFSSQRSARFYFSSEYPSSHMK